ncbi:type II secretion system protein GspM [Henriciella sp. AS95]|uniref:type II secretion system protein GspM n=1 Tax=Henriciella sp. AS95 TaxID=3135782 RepID=UPI003172637E
MSGWWETLSGREKGLIGAAGLLLLCVFVWYGLVSPISSARDTARLDRLAAADELSRIERLAASIRARSASSAAVPVSSNAAMNADAFKTAVTQQAQSAGLSIARLQSSDEGRFSLVFEQVDPRQLFYWMSSVETQLGGRIERMSVDQAGNGRVRATIELSGGAGT